VVVERTGVVVVVTGAVVAVVGAVWVAINIFWIVAPDGLRIFAPWGTKAIVISEFSVKWTAAGLAVTVGVVDAKLGQ
jgi:hypothetical protein